jgi:hypothetical protein
MTTQLTKAERLAELQELINNADACFLECEAAGIDSSYYDDMRIAFRRDFNAVFDEPE